MAERHGTVSVGGGPEGFASRDEVVVFIGRYAAAGQVASAASAGAPGRA